MKNKLEIILLILALSAGGIACTGAALDKRAVIYEKEETKIEQGMMYGGGAGSVISIIAGSYVYDRNNRKKEKSHI